MNTVIPRLTRLLWQAKDRVEQNSRYTAYIKLGFGLGGVALILFWGGCHQVLGGCYL